MALGKQNQNSDGKLYILRPTTKDAQKNKVDPHFSVLEKIDGAWKETRKEGNVSGDLFKVEIKEVNLPKGKFKTITLGLRDKTSNEAYLVDLRFNLTSRNLFNMLASLNNFDGLSISYYQGKNGYDRYSLRQADTLVPWKYKIEELPKPIEVIFKGETQRDYTPVDDLFEKELNTIAAKLGNKNEAVPTATAQISSTAADKDGDVPF